MNDDGLILLVEQNPLLYDKFNWEYKDANKKKQVWAQIASELGAPVETCMKRWTSLRDRYGRELRAQQGASGSGATCPSKWLYFQHMGFLRGHMFPRKRQISNFSFSFEEDFLEEADLPTLSPSSVPTPSPLSVPTPSPLSVPLSPNVLGSGPQSVSSQSPSPNFSATKATTTQPPKKKQKNDDDETTVAFMQLSSAVTQMCKEDAAPIDPTAHNFGKFVESSLTNMDEAEKFALIGEITDILVRRKINK